MCGLRYLVMWPLLHTDQRQHHTRRSSPHKSSWQLDYNADIEHLLVGQVTQVSSLLGTASHAGPWISDTASCSQAWLHEGPVAVLVVRMLCTTSAVAATGISEVPTAQHQSQARCLVG